MLLHVSEICLKVGRGLWTKETSFRYEGNGRVDDTVRVGHADVWKVLLIGVRGLDWEFLSAIMHEYGKFVKYISKPTYLTNVNVVFAGDAESGNCVVVAMLVLVLVAVVVAPVTILKSMGDK